MNNEEHLDAWVAGRSVHDDEDLCCPDFSCCFPELLWPVEQRRAFKAAMLAGDVVTVMKAIEQSISTMMKHQGCVSVQVLDIADCPPSSRELQ